MASTAGPSQRSTHPAGSLPPRYFEVSKNTSLELSRVGWMGREAQVQGPRQCTGTPARSQPLMQHRDLLCTTFLGKIMKVHYVWRQNGWRSGQECWVSKSCRLDERRVLRGRRKRPCWKQ